MKLRPFFFAIAFAVLSLVCLYVAGGILMDHQNAKHSTTRAR